MFKSDEPFFLGGGGGGIGQQTSFVTKVFNKIHPQKHWLAFVVIICKIFQNHKLRFRYEKKIKGLKAIVMFRIKYWYPPIKFSKTQFFTIKIFIVIINANEQPIQKTGVYI